MIPRARIEAAAAFLRLPLRSAADLARLAAHWRTLVQNPGGNPFNCRDTEAEFAAINAEIERRAA